MTNPGLSIHYGHYLSHVTRMPLANPPQRQPPRHVLERKPVPSFSGSGSPPIRRSVLRR